MAVQQRIHFLEIHGFASLPETYSIWENETEAITMVSHKMPRNVMSFLFFPFFKRKSCIYKRRKDSTFCDSPYYKINDSIIYKFCRSFYLLGTEILLETPRWLRYFGIITSKFKYYKCNYKNYVNMQFSICFRYNLSKTFYKCQHYEDKIFFLITRSYKAIYDNANIM